MSDRPAAPARMIVSLTLLGALLACGGGRDPDPAATDQQPAATADTVASAAPAPTTGATLVIGPDGIGEARPGRTLGQVRSALPDGARVGGLDAGFMVDVAALPIIHGADTLYYLLVPAGTTPQTEPDEATPVQLVATRSAHVRTAEGVGPGTTLAEAARVYGPPTLSWHVDDESREYAAFPDHPGERIRFRVAPASDDSAFAGVYQTTAEYNRTTRYDPAARIHMVLIDLQRR